MVEVSSHFEQLFFFFFIRLARPDLELLAAKPSSPEDHFWACFGTVLAALRAE